MKKIWVLTIIFFLFLNYIPTVKGNFSVSPREISVKIDKGFQKMNKTSFITVQNPNNYSINITYYVDNPDPISWIRPNRTLIPDLSWIYIKPIYQVISPMSSEKFYINHNIPIKDENLNKNWEVWIVFKQEESGFLNFENVIRLLIDTPKQIDSKDSGKDFLSISKYNDDRLQFSNFIIFVLIIILALIVVLIFNKEKKSN